MRLDKQKGAHFDAPAVAVILRHAAGLPPGENASVPRDIVEPDAILDVPATTLRNAITECRSMLRQIGVRGRKSNENFVVWLELLIQSFTEALDTQDARRSVGANICSSCGKRERRFGDLCGRCAEAQGIRPKGKI